MREYLKISNLKRSALLGGVVALLGTPRILQGGVAVGILVPSAFLLMTLVAGAVMAWGEKGGMVGAFPARRTLWSGLCFGVALGLVCGVARIFWGDDELRRVLRDAGPAARFDLSFPSDAGGKVALVLWVAGFQVLFFQAGTLSFLCRIMGRWEYALIVLGVLRVFVAHLQFHSMGVPPILSAYLLGTLATLIGATLFARGGLPGAVAFSALVELRLFFENG